MKKTNLLGLVLLTACMACNNSAKDPVDRADSINDANRDSVIDNHNGVTVDEASADFLVRAANGGKAEMELTSMAEQQATRAEIKAFAAMLNKDHHELSNQVRSLAQARHVTLPDSLTTEKQNELNDLKKLKKDFDKSFIREIIDAHDESIRLFEKANDDAKDAEVRTLASNALPRLRMHRDSAKSLLDRFW